MSEQPKRPAKTTASAVQWQSNSVMDNQNAGVLADIRLTQPQLVQLHRLHRRFLNREPKGRRVRMTRCDLRGLILRDMDFTEGEFVQCNFAGADLSHATFHNATMLSCVLDRATMTFTDFNGADLRGADFRGADLDRRRHPGRRLCRRQPA